VARQLRQFSASSYWFVTDRCHQEQFLLRPDEAANVAMLGALRRALERFAGQLDCYSVLLMSNHWHIVVRVASTEVLPSFMQYLKSQVATDVNDLRDRRTGTFWSARYGAVPILDEESLIDRIGYTLMNPVAAGIAATCAEHVGISSLEHSTGLRAACGPVDLPLALPPSWEGLNEHELSLKKKWLRHELREREREVKADRIGKGLARPKAERCRGMDPFDRPARPARRPRPSCFGATAEARKEHRASMRELQRGYAGVSELYRAGDMSVVFPHGTFPPRLQRPLLEAPG
jgi:putative transposase